MAPEAARAALREVLITPAEALGDKMRSISVGPEEAKRLREGGQPVAQTFQGPDIPFLAPGDMIKVLDVQGELVAVVEMLLSSEQFPAGERGVRTARLLRVFSPTQSDSNP
jgi:hypothetical protein